MNAAQSGPLRSSRRTVPDFSVDAPHTLDAAEVLSRLGVDESVGLDAPEVERRRRAVGRNALEQRRELSVWSILWDQVRSAVVVLLVAAVVAGIAIGEYIEAAAVAVVLLVNTALDLALDEARTATFIAITTAQLLAVFNARTDRGSGFRGATSNPYLWGALALTVTLEALALGVGPLRDLLGLTVLSPTAWAIALGLATVPLVVTQTVRIWRDRGTAPHALRQAATAAASQ